MADPALDSEIGASIPGHILKLLVKENDAVNAGQSLAVIEAMKMETNVIAAKAGRVETIHVKEGQQVKTGQLILTLV
jgi:pyruvate carboxylase